MLPLADPTSPKGVTGREEEATVVSPPQPVRSEALAPTEPSSAIRASGDSDNVVPGSIGPGSVIGGTYRVLGEIGRGGMGVVLLALDERLERRVAIKLIRSDIVEPGFYGRFMREARAMAQVNHPNVLCIYAFGEHEGMPYFVTELVEGLTLEAWLNARKAPPDLESALRILDDVCHAVEAIHAAGTVHRDLKPSNILIDRKLRSRVADFGVSMRYSGASAMVGELAGTPAYMAPEVALAEGQVARPSPLSDIYSLGCIAFELLTGRRPFKAQGEFAWMVQHMTQPVPVPSEVRPDLPKTFDRVLFEALAKLPEERTASVEELRRSLIAASREALEPERILVAEDDEDFRDVLRLTLEREFPDSEVVCVENGCAALDVLTNKPASIALIDLSMPMLDGVALTAALRQREAQRGASARMPIIVLTGRGGAADWQALSSMGADRFLVKPVNMSDLVGLIRSTLAATFGLPAPKS
jgi:serine/threonine protein kinase